MESEALSTLWSLLRQIVFVTSAVLAICSLSAILAGHVVDLSDRTKVDFGGWIDVAWTVVLAALAYPSPGPIWMSRLLSLAFWQLAVGGVVILTVVNLAGAWKVGMTLQSKRELLWVYARALMAGIYGVFKYILGFRRRPSIGVAGETARAACPSCSGAVQPEARFCQGCGHSLVEVGP